MHWRQNRAITASTTPSQRSRAVVDELGAEVRDDGGTGNRLDQLDEAFGDVRRQLEALVDQQSDRSADEAIQALARRVDEVAALAHEDDVVTGRLDELSGSLTELSAQLAALTDEHHDRGHDHEALATLASRVEDLAAGLTETHVEPDGRIDELAHAVTVELRADIATLADPSREHDVREAVRSLASRIDELAVPPDDGVVTNRLDTIERQRATDAETIDVLLLALDRIREDLSERQPARAEHSGENDGRLDELDRAFAEVQAQLASLDERPSDPGFEERLAGLAARVEAIDTAAPQTLEADPRIDVLVQSLAELRDELSSVAARPREQGADEALATLAARVDEIASAPPPAPEADPRIDVLARSVSELRDELASLAGRPHDHTADDALALLTARVEEIAATPAPSYEPDPRVDELGDALAELRRRIESLAVPPREPADDGMLAALTSRVDALTSAPPAVDEERLRGIESLAERLETLSRDLEARLAVADPVGGEGIDATVPDQLERVRLSIERFGLHLGEHDRALADPHAQSWCRAPRRRACRARGSARCGPSGRRCRGSRCRGPRRLGRHARAGATGGGGRSCLAGRSREAHVATREARLGDRLAPAATRGRRHAVAPPSASVVSTSQDRPG